MALLSRLSSTCRSLAGSPRTAVGVRGSTKTTSSSSFSSTRATSMSAVSSTTVCRSKSMISSSIFPASSFEKSRMSLMTVSSDSEQVRTVSAYSCCIASSRVSSSSPDMPMMPLRGVRISCLMLATNSDFTRAACTA
jgi:hypothetical protein